MPALGNIRPSDTFEGYAASKGFPTERHSTVTRDGYTLTLFRLPQDRNATTGGPAPVVLLQHGILASAWCWLVGADVSRAPAFALHRLGYDVWLSNSRGNTYSRGSLDSKALKPERFWNFTFEEMGRFDVSANVDYVLARTGRADLTFLAWSQGATQFAQAAVGSVQFADAGYDPALPSKINLYAAVSPVAYLKHATSTFLDALATTRLGYALYAVDKLGFLTPWPSPLNWFADFACKATLGEVCKLTVDVFCGTSDADDAALINDIAAHFPAGTSVKDLLHYTQPPPRYNLSAWPADLPVALFLAENDALVAPPDAARQVAEMNASLARPVRFARTYSGFSHLTWFVGKASSTPWLPDLAALLQQFNPV
eukprot:g4801.t1